MPCPVCGTKIPFDTYGLLRGEKFTCSECNASIGLASESKPIVQEVLEKLETIKKSSSKPAAENEKTSIENIFQLAHSQNI
jgi:transcription initiation factor IIE alpha subunit